MPAPRKYPDELRERAVREVRTTGRPIAHVARDLGIHKEALRGWVRQAEADAGERDDRLTTAEREELKQLRRENAELRRANEILKAASAFFGGGTRPSPDEADQVIEHLKDKGLGVGFVCRVLGLSESAYYARKKRPKSARRLRDEQLMPLIEQVHAESGGTYGARRITRALRRKGVAVARCTVERLMRELGLEGVTRGQRRRTTVPEPAAPRPPDLVERDFTATRPNQLWVADLTYVRTWSGWAYVAFVLDVYSRMIVGWRVANHMRTDLPLDALEMALWRRKIKKDSGLVHHSDRGSQYVSIRYTDRLADVGASASVGSVADSYDNAMAEALNGTFKAELIEMQGPWKDADQVERAVFQWVTWYNEERLHSALGYVPPAEYERDYWRRLEQPPQSA
ncbi:MULTISPECIES: IS3 family transposase [unclassified Streptomyces]|uniref:IS3 family transposase n=1 Tax=Streptomyces sp. NBRC 14336 TaxID=3030992 RepID=UPI0025565480|nr:IS3 family transposase [Streptomyces sp. NBRC 14336]WBO77801.1 IS3 family transposase [Streptomyces sp. SBE_14.2]WBO77825.1 IS3 family transposase [Streptomyces sp. SBE_14.2]WBO79014.1 IS3 family transposase [Streptomyces sp. SBE_14.2]WBO79662.1 IS3 family transposase [Streptomyces sp. SBE_14.2]WBO80815.1 IS3 family transposase [Streptomyces sp. SBE_14.2]